MSLLIHRAERADRLVDALGTLLSDPLPDPFATEIVSVPTPGVERWLSQRLSARLGARPGHADGVCAGVDFCSPRRLVARALNGSHGPEASDPWRPEQAVWPLLQVIEDARSEDWARLLWSHLESGAGRRWSVTRHLAELFAAYAATRPGMVEAWSVGQDIDAARRPLGADRAWQAELWRRLRVAVDHPGPAEQVATAVRELRASPDSCDLPARLSVFGATRLDPDHLAVLAALSAHRDVHLWLPHPSSALWEKVQAHLAGEDTTRSRRRADDRTEALVEHRLLAYLGRDARELQLMVAAAGAELVDQPVPPPTAPAPDTLLGRLQHDIATDTGPRPVEERWPLPPDDRSIVLHASHGPDRQVEVLREVLVGLLADDPTLEPRDIVVMCPDIETYAPLIAAAFGLDTAEAEAEHPGHRLRVRLADRSLRQLNPLLAVVSRLVTLADGRMPVSALLDLCASAPVARKFRFTADDLDRLQDLVARAGVRWGLDAERRSRYGLADFGQNTWAAGLDRLLLGVAMDETEQRFIGTALPMDDVDSSDVDLVGRLAECVARVRTLTDACPVAAAGDRLGGLVQAGPGPADRGLPRRPAGSSATPTPSSTGWPTRPRPGRADEADPDRRLRPAGRGLPRPGQPSQLPHRDADRGHPAADARRAPPGGLPARHRRRHLPAATTARRRRHHRDRPVGRRPRSPQRGPTAAARCDHGRRGPAGRGLRGPGPAHERRDPAGRADRRAARGARPHRPDHRRPAGPGARGRPAPVAALRPSELPTGPSWAHPWASASTRGPCGRYARPRRTRMPPVPRFAPDPLPPLPGDRTGRAGRPAPLLRPPRPRAAPGPGRSVPSGRRRAARRADPRAASRVGPLGGGRPDAPAAPAGPRPQPAPGRGMAAGRGPTPDARRPGAGPAGRGGRRGGRRSR